MSDFAGVIFNIAPSGLYFMIVVNYAVGTRELAKIGALVHRSRSLVYSTGIAPALAAAALAALRLAQTEEWRRERLRHNLQRLVQGLADLGFTVVHEDPAPMLVVVVGEAEPTLALARRLEESGVLAPAVRPPTVPEGSSRLRLAPMATHSDQDVDAALAAFPSPDELHGGSP